MFTGLVAAVGTLDRVDRTADGARLRVGCALAGPHLTLGESVSVSGVCLTVEEAEERGFTACAMPETLRRSTLRAAQAGTRVNLERAVTPSTPLGGHIVQGHVDGIGRILELRQEGVSRVARITAPGTILPHLVERGSVAVDGISLTVSAVFADGFAVAIIPATWAATTAGDWAPGREVNLEADIVSKYVARLLEFLPHRQAAAGKGAGVA